MSGPEQARRFMVTVLASAAIVSATVPALASNAATFQPTGSMNHARAFHTATLLRTGMVLVAGGFDIPHFPPPGPPISPFAELYDPHTGMWTSTGSMHVARAAHTATLLKDGRVLVAGGEHSTRTGPALNNTAELYDPHTGEWTLTGSMHLAREDHTATLLADGKVLVAGGETLVSTTAGPSPTNSAELYDPSTGTWAFTGSMNVARVDHDATSLRNMAAGGGGVGNLWWDEGAQEVLVTGGATATGFATNTVEIYDSNTGAWRLTTSMQIARFDHVAALIKTTQQVLVAGGNPSCECTASSGFTNTAEVFDLRTETWSMTESMAFPRNDGAGTVLKDGLVLVSGGHVAFDQPQATAEIYDPESGKWRSAGLMSSKRAGHSSTLLKDGTVLLAGGLFQPPKATSSADLFDGP